MPGAHEEDAPLVVTADMLADEPADDRVDFERGMSYWPPTTLACLVTLAAVFGWQLASGAFASQNALIDAGALVRNRVIEGEWWRLASATVLHGSAEHLLGNCVALYILGLACEHALGGWRLLVLYLASGLAGSAASVISGPGPSVGASGAICGLMGAAVVVLFRYRHVYLVRNKEIGFVLAGWAAYTIFIGAITPMIDNWAHFGGLLGGAVVALGMQPRVRGSGEATGA
jgi:rhomboid protease GluP